MDGITTIAGIEIPSTDVLLLTAFYVDNGKQLPLWKELPVWTYWSLPALVGMPIIVWALLGHCVVRQSNAVG